MQKQIENDGDENDTTQYIGNRNITTALNTLKAELIRVRINTTQMVRDGEGIEETVEANQARPSVMENEARNNYGLLNDPGM